MVAPIAGIQVIMLAAWCTRLFFLFRKLGPSIMSSNLNNHRLLPLPDELISYILEHTDYKAVIACRRVGPPRLLPLQSTLSDR